MTMICFLQRPSSRRTVGPLSKSLGRNNRGLMGPLCRKKRVQNSICKQTLPLPNSNFSSTDRKSGSSKRGQQTSTQKGSGEGRTGRSRLLFSYFPGSQEEREITTNNRSVQTEHFSGYSVVQNGDSQQGQTGDSTQRLGVLTRSYRCLSTCSYSPAVSEVYPFLSQGSGLSIQGSSIQPYDKSLCFHPFDGCHSNISTEKGNCTVSIFGRLVGQKSGSSRNSERPTVYNRTDYVPRTDNQRRKVRFGSVSELCVHRNGIPNTQEHSSSAIRQSTGHSGTVTVVQETETGLSKSLSVSSGKTKCCSSICSIGQATLTSTSNGSVCTMETSCASLRVSHSSQCSYQEVFGMVGQQVTFHLGCNTETVSTNTQSFHGCEPLRKGSPS